MSGVLGHTDHKSGIIGNNQHSRHYFEEWSWVSNGSVLGNGQMSWNFPQVGYINWSWADKRLFYFATNTSDNPDGGQYYNPIIGIVRTKSSYSGTLGWHEEWIENLIAGGADTFEARYWRPDNNNAYSYLSENYDANTYQLQIFIDDGNGNQRSDIKGFFFFFLVTTLPAHKH